MAVELQLRRGSETEVNAFTGAIGEVVVDTTNKTLRVHDGSTLGGTVIVTADGTQTLENKTISSPSVSGEITGDLIPSADITYDLGSASKRWNDLYLSGDTIDIGGATISVVGGSFEFKDDQGDPATVSLDANTTDDLSEGSTNLYYLDSRVDDHLSGGTGVTYSIGEISIGQAVGTSDAVTFDTVSATTSISTDTILSNDTSVTIDAPLIVSGDLTVQGNTTTINTTTLEVEDINVTVAKGATDASAANGAGLTADLGSDGSATFTYDSGNDRWSMNKSLATNLVGNVTGNVTGDLTGDVTGTVSDISNHTTNDLVEGLDNLYYTDERVRTAVSASGDLSYDSGTGVFSFTERTDSEVRGLFSGATGIDYNSSTGVFSLADTAVTAGSFGSASEVPVITIDAQGRITSATTSTVAGVSDFTYNNSTGVLDIDTADGSTFSATVQLGPFTTDDLSEGSTNLYYLDSRVDDHLSGGSGIDYSAGTISHSDTSSQTSVNNSSGNVIQDVTLDGFGHITSLGSVNLDDRYYTESEADANFVDVSGDTMAGFLTLHADPSTNLHAATKRYVDEVAQGLQAKPADDVATTANLDATYSTSNNTLTSNSNGAISVDGVSLSLGETVLVKDQTNAYENGSYEVTQVGDGSNPWILTRVSLMDETDEVLGAFEFIVGGDTNASTGYVATVPSDFALNDTSASADTDFATKGDIVWVQFSGAGSFTAGTGLDLNGNEFSHSDTSSVSNVTATSNTFVDGLTFDTFGHVTGVSTSTAAPPNDATITISAGSGLTTGGSFTTDQGTNDTITIDHADTSSQGSLTALTGSSVVSDIDLDGFGHVTNLSTRSLTLSDLGYTGATDADNYNGWTLRTGGTSRGTISSGESVNFVGGTNVDLSYSSTNNTITIDATSPPPNDATITLSAGSGLTGGGNFTTDQSSNETITVNHADTSSQSSVNNSGNTVIQDITLDGFGHITGLSSKTIDPPTLDTLGLDTNDDVQFDSLGIGTSATGVSGEIVATGDITSNASDDRLKTRLGTIENALYKVSTLSGFYFEFNDTAIGLGLQKGKRVGVSAQDVQNVLPEIVRESPVSNEYLTVQYEKLVPLLIEAIKEQSETIEDLKTRINSLENN